jgi:hypothetical protein
VPAQECCVLHDTESNKPNIIVTLITDIILLLIMLIGLLRLRHYGVGTFGLGQLLWKQVGISVGAVALHSLMQSPSPRVSFGSSLLPSPRLRQWYVQFFVTTLHFSHYSTLQVFIFLNLNGIYLCPICR